jgi:hypothetical protein
VPRIRTVKPEALQHRKLGRVSDRAFRLWLTMLTQADDAGRLSADPGQLRLLAFGYFPEVSESDVADALGELTVVGLVRTYVVDGTPWACFPSWADHQRISHPAPSKIPPPPPLASPREPSGILQKSPQGSEGSEGRKGRKEGSEDSGGTDFETFWSAYPRHEAKARALKAWRTLAPANGLAETILTALAQHKASWKDKEPDKIPHAATWLNGKRWEDELPQVKDPYANFPRYPRAEA